MSFHTVLHFSVVFLILSQILYCVVMMWYQCVAICCLLCRARPRAVQAGSLQMVSERTGFKTWRLGSNSGALRRDTLIHFITL